jgi:hypothetical protein
MINWVLRAEYCIEYFVAIPMILESRIPDMNPARTWGLADWPYPIQIHRKSDSFLTQRAIRHTQ